MEWRTRLDWVLLAAPVFLCLMTSAELRAQPPRDRVGQQFEKLTAWLREGGEYDGWRNYLLLDELDAQLEAPAGDRRVLERVLRRFTTGAKGLELGPFVRVRAPLRDWIRSLPPLQKPQLPAAAREAQDEFTPPTAAELERKRRELQSEIQSFGRYLRGGGPRRERLWKVYLRWDAMLENLATGDIPSLQQIDQDILPQYFQPVAGMEREPFLRMREALADYVNAALSAAPGVEPFFRRTLGELADRLDEFEQTPTDDLAVEIGVRMGYLSRMGQAPELLEAIRRYYGRPNLYLQASERLIAAGVDQQGADVEPIRENVLGTRIFGVARTTANTDVRLVPSAARGALDILVHGQSHTDATGYNGPVKLYTRGQTGLQGRARLWVSAEGLTIRPADASADTDTKLTGVAARSHLVRHIARKRFYNQQGQAEEIASQRASERFEERIDQQSAELVREANARYHNDFRNPLIQRGRFPEPLNVSSTGQYLHVNLVQAEESRLAASSGPPPLPGGYDFQARLHESWVGNFSEALLAGETLTDEELALLVERVRGQTPEDLEPDPEERWSITFDTERPVGAEFRDGVLTLSIGADRFTRDDEVVRTSARIAADYQVRRTRQGLVLARQGDVRVVAGRFRPAFQAFLMRKFEAVFREQLEPSGLQLPAAWRQAGELVLQYMEPNEGWLLVGWTLPTHRRAPYVLAR